MPDKLLVAFTGIRPGVRPRSSFRNRVGSAAFPTVASSQVRRTDPQGYDPRYLVKSRLLGGSGSFDARPLRYAAAEVISLIAARVIIHRWRGLFMHR